MKQAGKIFYFLNCMKFFKSMTKKAAVLILFIAFFSGISGFVLMPETGMPPGKIKSVTVAFYNVENLFDTVDDPAINDADFLPDGKMKWDNARLKIKLANLTKVISQLGDVDGPELLGLAEVENASVLKMLVEQPSLKKLGYDFVHHDSPDERGIDVALLYKKKIFFPLYTAHYGVPLEKAGDKTRDILLVKGLIGKDHEVTVIINHWPSRRGGQESSEVARMSAAKVVRGLVDSIYSFDPFASVVIMGDLNDDPKDKSIHEVLKAGMDTLEAKATLLYNPMYALHKVDSYGSLMYQKKWNVFDQIIVNKPLIAATSQLRYEAGSAQIYQPDWMKVDKEGDWKGAPKRMYIGDNFKEDGYSDHFPVYIRLNY